MALGLDHCFGAVRLHRVEATVRPENAASRAVLAKVGFREEGLLRRYLEVDGAWRDHLLVAITAEEVRVGGSSWCAQAGPVATSLGATVGLERAQGVIAPGSRLE